MAPFIGDMDTIAVATCKRYIATMQLSLQIDRHAQDGHQDPSQTWNNLDKRDLPCKINVSTGLRLQQALPHTMNASHTTQPTNYLSTLCITQCSCTKHFQQPSTQCTTSTVVAQIPPVRLFRRQTHPACDLRSHVCFRWGWLGPYKRLA